jgi:hypothetical protein
MTRMEIKSRDSLIIENIEIIEIIDINLNIISMVKVKEIRRDMNRKVKIQIKIVIMMAAEVTKSLSIVQNDLLYRKSKSKN